MRFESDAEDGDFFAFYIAAARIDDALCHAALTFGVDPYDSLDDVLRGIEFLADLGESERIFGEAWAAIAGAGMKEFAADPPVEADAFGDLLDVGAGFFAEIGDFVDESDFGR